MPGGFSSRPHGSSSNPFGGGSSSRRNALLYGSDEDHGSRRHTHGSTSRPSTHGNRHNCYNQPDDYSYRPYGNSSGQYGSSHGHGGLFASAGSSRSTPSFRNPTQETRHHDFNPPMNAPMRDAFDPRSRDLNRRRRRLMLGIGDDSSSGTTTIEENSDDALVNRPIRAGPQFQGFGPYGAQGVIPIVFRPVVAYHQPPQRHVGFVNHNSSRESPLRYGSSEPRTSRRDSSPHDCTLWDCDHPSESNSRRVFRNPFSDWGTGSSSRRR